MTQSRWQEGGRGGGYSAPTRGTSIFKRPVILFIFTFILIGIGFLIWWGYETFLTGKQDREVTTVYAEEGPYKVRPEDPHTHKIPHKEKTIYEHLSRQKAKKKEIKLRSLPDDPTEQGPTLPAEFIQAFSDQGGAETQELIEDDKSDRPSQSPFSEDASSSSFMIVGGGHSPLAEKEGFFKDSDEGGPRDLESQDSELSNEESSVFLAEGLDPEYPQTISCLDKISCPSPMARADTSCIEFCQASSEKTARQTWKSLQKTVPDLLAAQKVQVVKIDHGRPKGVRYHITLRKLPQKQASLLQKNLAERGIHTSLFPG